MYIYTENHDLLMCKFISKYSFIDLKFLFVVRICILVHVSQKLTEIKYDIFFHFVGVLSSALPCYLLRSGSSNLAPDPLVICCYHSTNCVTRYVHRSSVFIVY